MLNIIPKVSKISRYFHIIMVEIVTVAIKANLINKKTIVCSLIKTIYIIMISQNRPNIFKNNSTLEKDFHFCSTNGVISP